MGCNSAVSPRVFCPQMNPTDYIPRKTVYRLSSYQRCLQRLREKGVIVAQRIAMLPPSGEYAQVINTADYRMEGDKESEERCAAAPSDREIRYMKGE